MPRYRGGGCLGRAGQAELWYGTAAGTSGQLAARTASERSALRGELVERCDLIPVTVEGFKSQRFVVGTELKLLEKAEREVAAGGPPGGVDPGVAFLATLDPVSWARD